MLDVLSDYALQLAGQFDDPRKRLFLGYLACAAIIAFGWYKWRGASHRAAASAVFNRKVWTSPSALADAAVFAINQALTLLLAPALLAKLTVASAVYHALAGLAGTPGVLASAPPALAAALFTLALFLLDDWSRFQLHKWMHDIPWLWSFHQVHHSARTMSPLTVYRVHPVESVLYILRSSLVQGLCTAVFVFLFGNQLSLVSVLGASVFLFAFNALGSNLRHSHVRIAYWPALEQLLISPFQHQLHHSSARRHHNRNYGAVLAIWDRACGTLQTSAGQARPRFGTRRRPRDDEHSLRRLYWQPLLESGRLLRQRWRRSPLAHPFSAFRNRNP